MKIHNLSQEWNDIKPLLTEELEKLGANEAEIRYILTTTSEISSTIEVSLTEYARKELRYLREFF